MATFRKPVTIVRPDANVYPDLIANQITEAASPSIGDLIAYVLINHSADNGVYVQFSVPKNFATGGTTKLVVKGILDGAVSAGDDLAFGFRKRACASGEAADGTFDAEQTVQNTDIDATGLADEDYFEMSITLTSSDYAVDDQVYGYLYRDDGSTTYTGDVLLMAIEFEYTDG